MNNLARWPGWLAGRSLAAFRLVLVLGSMTLLVGLGLVLIRLNVVGQAFAFRIRTGWCRFALWVMGVRIHCTGTPDLSSGTLYVGNHRSFIDPLVAFSYIPKGYAVGKQEVASYPVVHAGAKLSGVVYVDRKDSQSRRTTKQVIADLLRAGMSVLIFPEATISITRKALPFRKGSFEAAVEAERPVVAFALELGDPERDFWYPQGLFGLYYQCFSKWRTHVYLHFFPPERGTVGETLCQQVEDRINEKLLEFQQQYWKGRQRSMA
ncbi:MAG: 1-acyl-sn-glycerol-3-phosphate acyltransferase [Saprospiraceae bacterium]|nr:1-acyl-sn-glycerol-3-phosphate acyltransferase [Saprospiraceae bacterium]